MCSPLGLVKMYLSGGDTLVPTGQNHRQNTSSGVTLGKMTAVRVKPVGGVGLVRGGVGSDKGAVVGTLVVGTLVVGSEAVGGSGAIVGGLPFGVIFNVKSLSCSDFSSNVPLARSTLFSARPCHRLNDPSPNLQHRQSPAESIRMKEYSEFCSGTGIISVTTVDGRIVVFRLSKGNCVSCLPNIG